jgi:hypothetical protein
LKNRFAPGAGSPYSYSEFEQPKITPGRNPRSILGSLNVQISSLWRPINRKPDLQTLGHSQLPEFQRGVMLLKSEIQISGSASNAEVAEVVKHAIEIRDPQNQNDDDEAIED